MAYPKLGVAGLLLLLQTGGCSSGRGSQEDPPTRLPNARAAYVGRYVAAAGAMTTKAGPDVLEVRADGRLEQRGPGGYVLTGTWEPLDEQRITAKPTGATWRRVYTLQPPAAKTGDGTFTMLDYTGE